MSHVKAALHVSTRQAKYLSWAANRLVNTTNLCHVLIYELVLCSVCTTMSLLKLICEYW